MANSNDLELRIKAVSTELERYEAAGDFGERWSQLFERHAALQKEQKNQLIGAEHANTDANVVRNNPGTMNFGNLGNGDFGNSYMGAENNGKSS